MKSGTLIVITLALFSSSVLALPAKQLNGKHTLDILKLHQQAGVFPQDFNDFRRQYYSSLGSCYNLITEAKNEVEKLLENSKNVVEQARAITANTKDEMTNLYAETFYSLNPDDPLEDTALVIDITVVRLTLLLVKAAHSIEDIVVKDAAELLPGLKSINKRVMMDVEQTLEPLMALVREVLPVELK